MLYLATKKVVSEQSVVDKGSIHKSGTKCAFMNEGRDSSLRPSENKVDKTLSRFSHQRHQRHQRPLELTLVDELTGDETTRVFTP